jgi:hypothetical protein
MRIEELEGAPNWLRYAHTENADVILNRLGQVVWRGGMWHGGVWYGGEMFIDRKKVSQFRCFAGLYGYRVHAVLFEDGSRWVRMGCLWKSLEEWQTIGIRCSNVCEFPDDGSEKSEERVRAFEFAKAAVLAMKGKP